MPLHLVLPFVLPNTIYIYQMKRTVQIDGAGRLVVPKDIRSRYGFEPGYDIEMEDTGTELVLRRVPSTEPVIEHLENGFPVIVWPPGTPIIPAEEYRTALRETRAARDRKLLGE